MLLQATRGVSFALGTGARATRPRAVAIGDAPYRASHRLHQFQPLLRQSIRIKTTAPTPGTKAIPGFANRLGRRSIFSKHKKRADGGARRKNSTGSAEAKEATEVPSMQTLRWVAFTTGLPFVGFGFMDNAILIIAGDAIDTSLGVTLGISTMCAAAIGNICSDLAGIGCAAYIEDFCATTLKMPVPTLSSAQRQLRSVRMASQVGCAIGMTIGCIIGMVPLFFIDPDKADKLKEKARLVRLYQDVLNEAKTLVGAESTCLYLRVDKNEKDGVDLKQKRKGVGLLPGYHPSVDGEYLFAMYYVEPHQEDNTSATDNFVRMITSRGRDAPIDSNQHNNNNNSYKKSTSATDTLVRMLSSGGRGTPIGSTDFTRRASNTGARNKEESSRETNDTIVGEMVVPPSSSTNQHNSSYKKSNSATDTLVRMLSSGGRGTPIGSTDFTPRPSNPGAHKEDEGSRETNDVIVGEMVVPPSSPATTPQHHAAPSRLIPVGKGIVSRAVLTGTTWNIAGSLMDEPDFYPLSIDTAGGSKDVNKNQFRDCVVVPILDGRGRVIAVLKALNKENTRDGTGGFTDQDVEILLSLASHVSVSLQGIYHDGDEELGLRETIRILKEGKGIKRSMTRKAKSSGSNSG